MHHLPCTIVVTAHISCKTHCMHSTGVSVFRLTLFLTAWHFLHCGKQISCVSKKVVLSLLRTAYDLMHKEYYIVMLLLHFLLPVMSISALVIECSATVMLHLL